ncbi:MAG: putative metalloprotease CJM1_0395 family protein [Pseudomonadota bacterium]
MNLTVSAPVTTSASTIAGQPALGSGAGVDASAAAKAPGTLPASNKTGAASTSGDSKSPGTAKSSSATVQLSDEALALLRKLQARDRQVKDHEQAHLAAAGGLATSGPSYSFEKGPDGVSYAVGGEVHIDVSPGRTPEDTIARAKTIQAAALAPADPSGPDLAVAAQARQMEQQAMAELQQQQAQQQQTRLAGAYSAASSTSNGSTRIDSYA